MNLLPMTYFIEVTKQRGISKAAESLQITQQTLSSHIAALEKELDCRLFVRRPKFRLTAEGELFLEYCEKFVGLDKSMREEFREMTGEIAGIVRVGISQTRSLILMPELITSFQKEYPRVKIYLSELANDELLSRIGDDELDIIIGDVSGERPDLETCELYREKMAVIIPKKPEYAPLAEALQETGDLRHLASWPMITNTRNDIVGRYISQVLSAEYRGHVGYCRNLPPTVCRGRGGLSLPGSLHPVLPGAGGQMHHGAPSLQLRHTHGDAEDRKKGSGRGTVRCLSEGIRNHLTFL